MGVPLREYGLCAVHAKACLYCCWWPCMPMCFFPLATCAVEALPGYRVSSLYMEMYKFAMECGKSVNLLDQNPAGCTICFEFDASLTTSTYIH